MNAIRRFLLNWWTLSLLTAALFAVIFVLLLPLVVSLLQPTPTRIAVFAGIVVVWLLACLWRAIAARRAAAHLRQSLEFGHAGDAEAKVLANKMGEALAALKAARNGRNYLYSRPWYVIIGPPAAGKSTALQNSGLRFLSSGAEQRGIAGTRNIEFLFADEAVLIDTAGRYTTQNSDSQRDRQAWAEFLGLLRKNRPMQPINGVIVALGIDQLVSADQAKIDEHAEIVRDRLTELQSRLELSLPVYVLLTKSDLLAGFVEFFDDLDVEGRRAVLGATFDWQKPARGPEAWGEAFDSVSQAVDARTSKRLQDECDIRRRGLIVGFPTQLVSLRSRLLRFLEHAFPVDVPEPASFRGFYFTSGIQQGTPFDRILDRVATLYDAALRAAGQGRAYFINRLLKDVVIAEAGLARPWPAVRARRNALVIGGVASILTVLLVVTGLWLVSFVENRDFLNTLAARSAAVAQQIGTQRLNLTRVAGTDPDLEQSLPVLTALRTLPGGYAERYGDGHSLFMTMGLYQENAGRAAELAYLNGLQRIMSPRLLLRLEQRMRSSGDDTLGLYDALKSYLMLGGQAPSLDRANLTASVGNDWANQVYPGPDLAATRSQLASHLDAMLNDPEFGHVWTNGRAPLDGALVETARGQVETIAPAERAYTMLKQAAAQAHGADWRAGSVLGAGAAKAFRNEQVTLALTVPYFYTLDGFQRAYQLRLPGVQNDLEKDLWVFGPDQTKLSTTESIRAVREGVAALYARDYIAAWDNVVSGIEPADYFDNQEGFRALVTEPSPLKLMMLQVSRNTRLSEAPTNAAAKAVGAALNAAVPAAVKNAAAAAIGQTEPATDASAAIEQHFKPLNDYVGDGKQPAPVDQFLAALRKAAAVNLTAKTAGGGQITEDASAALNQAMADLLQTALLAPEQLRGFTQAASKMGTSAQQSAQVSTMQNQISKNYAMSVGGACLTVTGVYPFLPNSPTDVQVADLQRLFGANGQIKTFVDTQLWQYMDTSGQTWRWKSSPVTAAFNPTTPAEFQKAQALADLVTSGLQIRVEPVSFAGGITAAEFSVGSGTARYRASEHAPHFFQWSPAAEAQAHLILLAGDKPVAQFSFKGVWALWRLLDRANLTNVRGDSFEATFAEGAQSAALRIVAVNGTLNPLRRDGAWRFHCPSSL